MAGLIARLKNEPAVIAGLVSAVIALLTAYRVNVTPDQATAIMGVTAAIAALFVRANVTPTGSTGSATVTQVQNAVALVENLKTAIAPAPPGPRPIAGVVEAQEVAQ